MHFTRLRRAFWQAFMHGQYSVAKAAAYSSILTLFPAFLVLTSVLEASHNTEGFLQLISTAVRWVLPPGSRSIALLVWLYIVSAIVLLGAEWNAQIYPKLPDNGVPKKRYKY